MLMRSAGMVKYVKRSGAIEILCRPASTDPVPRAVFVSPDTPYSNKLWLRRALEECSESIWWLDKHFMPVAFESLLDAADARRISEIRMVLSLDLPDNSGPKARKQYVDLRRELAAKGIRLAWRVIDSRQVRRARPLDPRTRPRAQRAQCDRDLLRTEARR